MRELVTPARARHHNHHRIALRPSSLYSFSHTLDTVDASNGGTSNFLTTIFIPFQDLGRTFEKERAFLYAIESLREIRSLEQWNVRLFHEW